MPSDALNIRGPAGNLQAQFDGAGDNTTIAVLCHPHPQYGGSMHDAVLDTVARVLLARNISCLRFNFRGVGASDGRYDQGQGEADDLRSVLAWVREGHADARLWLAGYSFGANVAWRVVPDSSVDRALLVAPPVGAMAFDGAADPAIPVDVFAGDADEFIDATALDAWQGVAVHRLPGANHFFMGAQDSLADALTAAIDRHGD